MSRKEALELISQKYSGYMEVTSDERITYWQAVKHLYHGVGVGVNPEDFGMTQKELTKLRNDGLVKYVRKGNKLPSRAHVRAYQEALNSICKDPQTQKRTDSKYYDINGVTPATVYYNRKEKQIVSFNQTTGDLITGDKQRDPVFRRFINDNTLGGLTWINRWNND